MKLAFLLVCACGAFQVTIAVDCNVTGTDCLNCFQDLANVLLNTGDNKFTLANTFFPPDEVPPIFVTVKYSFTSTDNNNIETSTWYWTQGSFFFYQPIEVLIWSSLLFSPPVWRSAKVTLVLPDTCKDASRYYFRLLTQRVR